MITRSRTTISIITFMFSLVPVIASAEGFVDLYGGFALGHSADAANQNFGDPFSFPSVPPGRTTKQLSFDSSGTFGVRGGYWLEPLPWLGLAADLSYFQRKAPSADIDLVPLSLLVMLRYPMLTSEQFPKGRLQPYVGVGPGLFYSHTSIDFGPPFGSVNHGSIEDVGFDGRAGVAWELHKRFAMFLEYRFTHVNLGYEKKVCRPRSFAEALSLVCVFAENPPEVTVSTTETTLNTHHILIGIRF
jgi:hypothetical protein